jgi:hypothetical protein
MFGHCDGRCPFSVKQSERMLEINSYVSEEDHQKRLTEDASARPEPEEQVIIF